MRLICLRGSDKNLLHLHFSQLQDLAGDQEYV